VLKFLLILICLIFDVMFFELSLSLWLNDDNLIVCLDKQIIKVTKANIIIPILAEKVRLKIQQSV